jgi:hypothetical protein
VTIDFITKLLLSKNLTIGVKYNSIFIVVDRLTKWVYYVPYKEIWIAEQLVDVVLRYIALVYRWLEEWIIDRDTKFISKF